MEVTNAMRFVIIRAQAEASNKIEKIFPEHILLGIFRYSELSSAEILPNTCLVEETDRDIAGLRQKFSSMKVDTRIAKDKLRGLMRQKPPAGDGRALTEQLLERAAERVKPKMLFPGDVLVDILENPTSVIRTVLKLR